MTGIEAFRLNNEVLFARIEEIKKNPPPKILEYKAAHPEFKTVNCALLAAYAGMSESTLKNLKLGKITDSNCSTAWMICTAFDIDPRDYFRIARASDCDPAACNAGAQAQLNEKIKRIEEMEAQYKDADSRLVNLRTIIKEQSEALGAAKERAEGLRCVIADREASIARRDKGIAVRNKIIVGCALFFAALLVADMLVSGAGWFRFGLL